METKTTRKGHVTSNDSKKSNKQAKGQAQVEDQEWKEKIKKIEMIGADRMALYKFAIEDVFNETEIDCKTGRALINDEDKLGEICAAILGMQWRSSNISDPEILYHWLCSAKEFYSMLDKLGIDTHIEYSEQFARLIFFKMLVSGSEQAFILNEDMKRHREQMANQRDNEN